MGAGSFFVHLSKKECFQRDKNGENVHLKTSLRRIAFCFIDKRDRFRDIAGYFSSATGDRLRSRK
jgi:hypothetical protein